MKNGSSNSLGIPIRFESEEQEHCRPDKVILPHVRKDLLHWSCNLMFVLCKPVIVQDTLYPTMTRSTPASPLHQMFALHSQFMRFQAHGMYRVALDYDPINTPKY